MTPSVVTTTKWSSTNFSNFRIDCLNLHYKAKGLRRQTWCLKLNVLDWTLMSIGTIWQSTPMAYLAENVPLPPFATLFPCGKSWSVLSSCWMSSTYSWTPSIGRPVKMLSFLMPIDSKLINSSSTRRWTLRSWRIRGMQASSGNYSSVTLGL